jgi:hypothetical protein
LRRLQWHTLRRVLADRAATEHGPPGPRAVSWSRSAGDLRLHVRAATGGAPYEGRAPEPIEPNSATTLGNRFDQTTVRPHTTAADVNGVRPAGAPHRCLRRIGVAGRGWGRPCGLPELRHVFGTTTRRRPVRTRHHRTHQRSAPDRVPTGQGPFWLVWRVKDSNLGRHQPTDSQSAAMRPGCARLLTESHQPCPPGVLHRERQCRVRDRGVRTDDADQSHRFAITGQNPRGNARTIILWRETELVDGTVVRRWCSRWTPR